MEDAGTVLDLAPDYRLGVGAVSSKRSGDGGRNQKAKTNNLCFFILVPEVCPDIEKQMNAARYIEPVDRLKAAELAVAMGDWVHFLAPWQVVAHLTFAWPASVWSAQRCYEKFMKREMWGVSYFYALEQNPGRDGFHVHALWCDCKSKSRRDLWQKWFTRYGRNRIEPVNCAMDVSDYCAKYVTKEGAWWAVNLVGHRHPRLKDFKLVVKCRSAVIKSAVFVPN